ncbi:hypothetical protein WDY80_02340 [Gordonia hongkongensis]|uniref:hypothetical protein n=1 Tax=Gordonia hongkongensis TaxID=1701090 RepID=UPI0030CD4EB0
MTRYAELEAHHDLGLGAEEPHVRRFTRLCERRPVATPGNASITRSIDFSGANTIRVEALARLEDQIEHQWRVWEGLREGTSRTTLASFIHDLEDRADQLAEDIRANQPGEESGPGRCADSEWSCSHCEQEKTLADGQVDEGEKSSPAKGTFHD